MIERLVEVEVELVENGVELVGRQLEARPGGRIDLGNERVAAVAEADGAHEDVGEVHDRRRAVRGEDAVAAWSAARHARPG